MGIVWEPFHKGVPLLGVLENPTDGRFRTSFGRTCVFQTSQNLIFDHLCLSIMIYGDDMGSPAKELFVDYIYINLKVQHMFNTKRTMDIEVLTY